MNQILVKKLGFSCFVLAGLLVGWNALGETLIWKGGSTVVWNKTNQNWEDEAGNPRAYVDGSDVIFPAMDGAAVTNVTGGYANLVVGSMTFNPVTRYTFSLDNNHQPLTFGAIEMMNGTTINSHSSKNSQVKLTGDIAVRRLESGASLASSMGGGMSFWNGKADGTPLTFCIEEVTSEDGTDDGVADFTIHGRGLLDKANAPCNWRKTGAGRIQINAGGSYTGSVDIVEGSIYYTASNIGSLYHDRTITFHAGTTMHCDGNGVPAGNEHATPTMTTVYSNATLNANASKSTVAGFFSFGNLVFLGNCTIRFNGGGWQHNGTTLRVGKLTSFELDDPCQWGNDMRFGVQLTTLNDTTTEVIDDVTHTYGLSEFRVKTARNAPIGLHDVTLSRGCKDTGYPKNSHTGILKTGDGIFAIKGGNSYTHITDVAEGGLWLEGSTRTDVRVRANAVIGGREALIGGVFSKTDYPANLTIEEGGGLLVDATNVTACITVHGDVSLPESGILMVANYTQPLEEISAILTGIPLPVSQNDTSAFDPSAWRVKLKGYERSAYKDLRVRKEEDGTLTVYPSRTGTKIVIR